MKTCTKCGEVKPIDAYARDRQKRDGRVSRCRACISAQNAAYYESNREKISAQNAAYREENREYAKAYAAAYREERLLARHAEAAEHYQAEGAFPIPAEVLSRRVGYQGAHDRVCRYYGPSRSQPCAAIGCDRQAAAWALVNPDSPHVHTEWLEDTRNPDRPPRRIPYSLNPQDYRPLCHSCHIRLDAHGQNVLEGAAT